MTLPGVADDNRKFTRLAVISNDVAGNGDFDFFAVERCNCDQRHVIAIIDVREMLEHAGRQFTQRIHEAEVARLAGQSAHEFVLDHCIRGPDRPQCDRRAVVKT